jgi:hypothetical protein
MKALRHPLVLAIIALTLYACGSQRDYAYAQGYDEYGYYDDRYYDDGYYNRGGGISFNVFYHELRPYGRWINSHSYGRVWIPNVGRDFHPYATNGYWVMTDHGNMWISNYSWGWAPFHYGRWYWDHYYGWAWVPGYEWAPAWVTWRSGGGYYGWAPLGPRVNIHVHVTLPRHYWTFLPTRHMYNRAMHKYYKRHSTTIYNNTTVINNTYVYNNNRYYSGPTPSEYQRTTGRSATVHRVESSNLRSNSGRTTVVNNNSVRVYRPETTASRTTSGNRSAVNTTRSSSSNRTTTSGSVSRSRSSTSSGSNRSAVNNTRSSSSNRSSGNTTVRSSSSSNRNTNAGDKSTVRSSSSGSRSNNDATTRSSSSSRSSSGRTSGGRR